LAASLAIRLEVVIQGTVRTAVVGEPPMENLAMEPVDMVKEAVHRAVA
jgi:hypothetical protein